MPRFSELKVEQLRQKLRELGLSAAGNKAQLVEKLCEHFNEERFASATYHSALFNESKEVGNSFEHTRDEERPLSSSSPVTVTVPSPSYTRVTTTANGATFTAPLKTDAYGGNWGANDGISQPTYYGDAAPIYPVTLPNVHGQPKVYVSSADANGRTNVSTVQYSSVPTVAHTYTNNAMFCVQSQPPIQNLPASADSRHVHWGAQTIMSQPTFSADSTVMADQKRNDVVQNELRYSYSTNRQQHVEMPNVIGRNEILNGNGQHFRWKNQTPIQYTIQQTNVRSNEIRNNVMPTLQERMLPHEVCRNVNNEMNTNKSVFFGDVRDIIAILPTYDPSKKNLTSEQFVKRVEQLRNVYNWNDKILLYAVQTKLEGVAKMWIDASAEIFLNWSHFANEFLNEFPCFVNAADVHMELMNMKRNYSESAESFYYRVLATGRRGNIDDASIIKYMVNGMNDVDLKRSISVNNYSTCNELLRAIINYCKYNTVKTSNWVKRVEEPTHSSAKKDNQTKKTICYNCNNPGHFSRNYSEPQKRERCTKCLKVGHSTNNCKTTVAKTNCNSVHKVENDFTIKEIEVNGLKTNAFVDTGSCRTLIRKSLACKIGQLENCCITLKGFGGASYECTSKLNVALNIDGNVCNTEMLVVDDNMIDYPVLLGINVIHGNDKHFVFKGNQMWVIEKPNNEILKLEDGEFGDLSKMLQKYKQCFTNEMGTVGKTSIVKMNIVLSSDTPVNVKPYRLPFARRSIVKNIIEDLLKCEIIRPSSSPYASPIVLVEKKDNSFRMCVDYRQLNKITVKQPYPMPIIDELFAQLSGNNFFTTLDFKMGYHQIEVSECSKRYTAFVTTEGHYEYNRMPFGLVNAPAVFQETMNKLVKSCESKNIIAYLDDVIIPSQSVKEGIRKLDNFLCVVKENGLTLRLDKCEFLKDEIDFLGHKISRDGIKPGERKVQAIKHFRIPTTQTEVRRFLGLTGFFRKFVENYSLIARPLTKLTTKVCKEQFEWGECQQKAFATLIDRLCNSPVLVLYDFNAQHQVHTDASSVGIAAVLLQAKCEGDKWQAVMYFSRHCTPAESSYHSYELEVLAVVEALQRFRIYLLGKSFKIFTDCSAISSLKAKTPPIPRISSPSNGIRR
ncbi:uncharacterized protein LOC129238219 [Anastrepha obliqua]|uniref:uncharacterized protein LOC129238219 n=1 Tax=Anastrepha obliqua TaxID=95512 RepID=UPI00240A2BE9|nr:uncharacterized protein LOC129238219 [Anastrepha obliqua]